jgi:hypothetical protein
VALGLDVPGWLGLGVPEGRTDGVAGERVTLGDGDGEAVDLPSGWAAQRWAASDSSPTV